MIHLSNFDETTADWAGVDHIAVDIETVSLLNPLPLGIAVAINSTQGLYFFDFHEPLLRMLLEKAPFIVFHNAAFDIPALRKLGFRIAAFEDSMLKAYSAGYMSLSLHYLSEQVLHKECPSVTDQWVVGQKANVGINHEVMGKISMIHACNTYALWDSLPLTTLYTEIDRPCVDLIMEMEAWGLEIDQCMLTEVEHIEVCKATKLKEELIKELGDINFGSPSQVTKALQTRGIIGTRKSKKTGAVSSSDESLKGLNNPIANKLLKWRSVMKTISTNVPAFRNVDSNGRVHTEFGYTQTGRWKSGNADTGKTNLQNLTNDSKFEVKE